MALAPGEKHENCKEDHELGSHNIQLSNPAPRLVSDPGQMTTFKISMFTQIKWKYHLLSSRMVKIYGIED